MALSDNVREVKGFSPEEVLERLDEHGLSQSTFARLVGVTQPSISRFLLHQQNPSALLRIRIAEVVEELDRNGPPKLSKNRGPRVPRVPRVRHL